MLLQVQPPRSSRCILGLTGMRRTYRYPSGMGWDSLNMIETVGAFVIGVGAHLLREPHLLHGAVAIAAATRGAALARWSIPSPPPAYNCSRDPRGRGRDDWWHRKYTEDADGNSCGCRPVVPTTPTTPRRPRQAARRTARPARRARPGARWWVGERHDHCGGRGAPTLLAAHLPCTTITPRVTATSTMPSPSYYPLVLAAGAPVRTPGLRGGVQRDPLGHPRSGAAAVRHVRLGPPSQSVEEG